MSKSTYARSRKQQSPQQLIEKAERRERLTTLSRRLQEMTEEQRLALAMGITLRTCEGHELSMFNTCMVITQNPSATIVGGFRQWQAQGRQVRTGEHGIAIWVPKYKPKDRQEDITTDLKHNFLLVTVFDIMQTDKIA